jgi:hypothetical protein
MCGHSRQNGAELSPAKCLVGLRGQVGGRPPAPEDGRSLQQDRSESRGGWKRWSHRPPRTHLAAKVDADPAVNPVIRQERFNPSRSPITSSPTAWTAARAGFVRATRCGTNRWWIGNDAKCSNCPPKTLVPYIIYKFG